MVIGCELSSIKRRIVSREAKNGDALPQRGLPEHEVPGWLRIQILHRDRQDAERITRQFCHKKPQHVSRENLAIMCQAVYPRCEIPMVDGRKSLGLQSKINRGVLLQEVERRAGPQGKFSERLQVNFPPPRVGPNRPRVLELTEGLA